MKFSSTNLLKEQCESRSFGAFLSIVMLILLSGVNSLYAKDKFVPIELGKKAPKLQSMKILGGKKESAAKANTLLVFWATWKAEAKNKSLFKLITEVQNNEAKFNIKMISREDKGVLTTYFANKKISTPPYSVYCDEAGQDSDAYLSSLKIASHQLPYFFVLDSEGVLIHHGDDRSLKSVMPKIAKGNFNYKKEAELKKHRENANEYLKGYTSSIQKNEIEKAKKYAQQLFAMGKSYPDGLVALARFIHMPFAMPTKDFNLALKASQAAYGYTAGKNMLALLYYAKSHESLGQLKEAIALYEKGIATASTPKDKKNFQKHLAALKRKMKQ